MKKLAIAFLATVALTACQQPAGAPTTGPVSLSAGANTADTSRLCTHEGICWRGMEQAAPQAEPMMKHHHKKKMKKHRKHRKAATNAAAPAAADKEGGKPETSGQPVK